MTRRPHLTLVRQAMSDEDYAYDPPFWMGILLSPIAYGVVLLAAMLWAAVLP